MSKNNWTHICKHDCILPISTSFLYEKIVIILNGDVCNLCYTTSIGIWIKLRRKSINGGYFLRLKFDDFKKYFKEIK